MKKSVFLLLFGCLCQTAMADNRITGVMKDEADGAPLVAATVVLCSESGVQVGGTTTDAEGHFQLTNIDSGNCLLRFSYIGYEPQSLLLTNLKGDIDVGEVLLSPAANALAEVEVRGESVLKKADRQLLLPTTAQRRASTNGVSLLQHLQIPGLSVSPLDRTVTTAYGEAVQLRINGVEVTREEMLALRPSEVVRIEYFDNPGVRYGSVAAVLNYIVKRKERGGSLATDLTNGVSPIGFGEYQLSGRLHSGCSSIALQASLERRDLTWNRENTELFVYPDRTVENREVGMPTRVKYANLNTSFTYTYTDGERSLLNIALRNRLNDTPHSAYDRNSTLQQEEHEYRITDRLRSDQCIPSLDLYYQLNLKGDRRLYFDVVGTYLSSHSHRTYTLTEEESAPVQILSETEGDKYSLIGEAIYEQPLGKGSLTAGLKHTQARVNNVYDGDISSRITLHSAESYLFAEYRSDFRRLNYTLGLGAMRTCFRQSGLRQEKFIFRPRLTLSYKPADRIFLKYNATMSGYAPSLSALSDVEQAMDAYQVRRGNPGLKNATYFSNDLSFSLHGGRVSVELFARYSFDRRPIMEETHYEADRFVRTYANQRGFHRLNLRANVQLRPWRDHLMLTLSPFFNRYISQGNEYLHTHSNHGVRGSLIGMYREWSLMVEMNTSQHELWGETLTEGEALHSVAVGYNREKWGVQAMVMNPFGKNYRQTISDLSRLAPNRQLAYSRDFSPMLMVNVSLNLDFGKQRSERGKRISNSDSDTGILQGSK